MAQRMAAVGNFSKLQQAREQGFYADALVAKARAEQKAEAVIALVKERLEDGVYTDQDDSLSAHISRLFLEAGLTLGFAESCTGGLLSQLITERAGASGFFRGAIVSYDNAVKTSILGVSELSLRDAGAVSEEVARQMAEGARRALGVDVSLAVTGIAGPGGGSADKPVGLVHWAVSHAGGTGCFQSTFRGARSQIQKRAAVAGLDSVRRVLQRLGTGA